MKKRLLFTSLVVFLGVMLLAQFTKGRTKEKAELASLEQLQQANKQQLQLGERLVYIGGCHDCHTPKKMTDKGPVMDFSRALSGHPAKLPPPDVDRKEIEQKGLAVTQTLTAWVGPWGISYAANLTSDPTGIGNWTEKNFFTAIRQGKHKGIESGRMLLPPMPWDMISHMTDEELRAVFAYLKSTKPIKNVVPPAQPPVSAAAGK
ncbi:c-type cytochrome [Pontibacter korlensis]|uniref:Diheme cytochrome c-553 n=1 Tax=Pontibacter korlensis TaxID=400092 RepID=A0A0E3UX92_9BACT|nr:c-type cytochrome [Pontibacter korlensis]AKD04032.1 diheme cytochrome c-553 [Pontibacter korlensis]